MITSMVIGAAIGAAWSKFFSDESAPAEKSAPWTRTALYGAMIGLLLHSFSGGTYRVPKNITPVTSTNFEAQVTRSGMPVLADFYAPWCGPCKKLAPVLDELAKEFSGRVRFVSINVDDEPVLAKKFKVEGIPTLIFFTPDGKTADTLFGLAPKGLLKEKIEALAANRRGPAQSDTASAAAGNSETRSGSAPSGSSSRRNTDL